MKRMFLAVISIAFLLSIGSNLAVAQTPMTNADVIALVKANLSENNIVAAIQQSPCNFDLSSRSLIDLKNQQVPENVIQAMITKAGSPGASQTRTAAMPGMLGQVQFLYKGAKGLVPLETPLLLSTEGRTGVSGVAASFVPFGGSVKEVEVFQGARAKLQISESAPTFIISNAAGVRPEAIYIAHLEQKGDTRILQVGKMSGLGSNSRVPKKSLREVTTAQLPDGSLSVTPTQALADGEYIIYQLQGQSYEFGISNGR